jgi:ribosomal-protein-serine acetyltransferase
MAECSSPMSRLPERIEGDGILLRRWLVGDVEAQHRAVAESAEHLRPWMSWMSEEPQALERRRAMLARWEREWWDGGDALLGVFVDDAVAGSCGLHRRRGPDVLEIGYWIHVSFVRRGLATKVAALLTDAAFAVPRIQYVEIHHDKANIASSGVPRRLGFRLVGEGPDEVAAPAELGIDCVWRIDNDRWRASSRSVGTTPPPAARQ